MLTLVVASDDGALPGTRIGPGLAAVGSQRPAPSSPVSPSATPGPSAAPSTVDPGTPPIDPPPGALPAHEAVANLAAAGASLASDVDGHVVAVVRKEGSTLSAESGTDAFTRTYAAAFGVPDGSGLREVSTRPVGGGDTVTRYQQEVNGVPVMGGEIMVTADNRGQVLAATAATASVLPATTTPNVAAQTAVTTAVVRTAKLSGRTAAELTGQAALWLYEPSLMSVPGAGGLRPTWLVKVADGYGMELATVLVDAGDGTVALAVSNQKSADRIVCDMKNRRDITGDLNNYACNPYSAAGLASTTRQEGEPASTVSDVNKAYQFLGATRGRPITFPLSANAPFNCPSVPPQFTVIWSPPRPPGTVEDSCSGYLPPRRS